MEFKDFILGFFQYKGSMRPTMAQVRAHPWMQSETFDIEASREQLLNKIKSSSRFESETDEVFLATGQYGPKVAEEAKSPRKLFDEKSPVTSQSPLSLSTSSRGNFQDEPATFASAWE